jgi:hypothetical protein
VSGFQIKYLIRADKSATQTAAAALKSAEAAEQMARAADLQYKFAGKQTEILERQQGLLNAQFLVEHRPKVVLKNLYFTKDKDFSEVTYELFNSGGSEANIISGFIGVDFVKDERQFIWGRDEAVAEEDWITSEGNIVIGPGFPEIRPYAVNDTLAVIFSIAEERRADILGKVYFYGRVVYVDVRGEEFGIKRMSVFRRIWDPVSKGFVRTGNPDHEYSD